MIESQKPINQSGDEDEIPPPDEKLEDFLQESEDPDKKKGFELDDDDNS